MADGTPGEESLMDSTGVFPHGSVEGGESTPVPLAYQSNTLSNSPFMATSAVNDSQRFPVPTWAPRSGRTLQYHKFFSGVKQLCGAFGLTLAEFRKGAPSACIIGRPASMHMHGWQYVYEQWFCI